jgi:hypothetical protein
VDRLTVQGRSNGFILEGPSRAIYRRPVYSVAIAAFGGTTLLLGTWLIHIAGSAVAPAWFVIGAAMFGQIALMLMLCRRARRTDCQERPSQRQSPKPQPKVFTSALGQERSFDLRPAQCPLRAEGGHSPRVARSLPNWQTMLLGSSSDIKDCTALTYWAGRKDRMIRRSFMVPKFQLVTIDEFRYAPSHPLHRDGASSQVSISRALNK